MKGKPVIWGIVAVALLMAAFWLGMEADRPVINNDEQLVLVPEGWRRLDDYTIVIDAGILAGELRAVWVEYGLEAGNLNQETPPSSEELGMGTRGEYGSYSLTIPHSELEPGRSYFYRIKAETEKGEMIETGLNRFTAGK